MITINTIHIALNIIIIIVIVMALVSPEISYAQGYSVTIAVYYFHSEITSLLCRRDEKRDACLKLNEARVN